MMGFLQLRTHDRSVAIAFNGQAGDVSLALVGRLTVISGASFNLVVKQRADVRVPKNPIHFMDEIFR